MPMPEHQTLYSVPYLDRRCTLLGSPVALSQRRDLCPHADNNISESYVCPHAGREDTHRTQIYYYDTYVVV
jgi:hypothetical protein